MERDQRQPTPQSDSVLDRSPGDTCDVRGADPTHVRRGRSALLDDEFYARLAEIFRTLADSSRARIVHSLLQQDLCTCDLAAITGLSEPAVSQHLRILRALRLVKSRREGKRVYYSLDDDHVRLLLTLSLQHLAHETNELPTLVAAAQDTKGKRAILSPTSVPWEANPSES